MIGALRLPNPVICGSGEPVMTHAGIRAVLRAEVAGAWPSSGPATALHCARLLQWHLPLLQFHTMVAQNGSGARP